MSASAYILEDVINPQGDRLTIQVVKIWRPVLAELNTHRSHSRSSASSRAIPVAKQLKAVIDDPAWPIVWASEQPGMQGGADLEGDDLVAAQALFEYVHRTTVSAIQSYLASTRLIYGDDAPAHTLHKSLLNRLIEPFMWHTVIFGATDEGWANFFAQRATKHSPLAMPELRAAVDLMLDNMESSEPRIVDYGQWVTPFVKDEECFEDILGSDRLKVSAARCARVSYLNHEGVRDPQADIDLYTKLVGAKPKHAAPLEFVCTPVRVEAPQVGNFKGYAQLRHYVERGEFA